MNKYLRDEMIGRLVFCADSYKYGVMKSLAEVKDNMTRIVREYEEKADKK